MKNVIPFDAFCGTCLELWKGCVLAGIFAMSTSIFDLIWSVVNMIDEEDITFFYLLFCIGIESIIFITVTGLLFVALVKKSKCLLLPWLILATVDVVFGLTIAFAELILPSNLNSSSCSLPILSTVVTMLVCIIMIYCIMIVASQYIEYDNIARAMEIRVTPVRDDMVTITDRNPIDAGKCANTLEVPHISTPKDAW